MKKLLFIRTRPFESNTSSSIRAIATADLLHKCGYEITLLTTNAGISNDEWKEYPSIKKIVRIHVSGAYEAMRQVKNSSASKASIKNRLIVKAKKLYREFKVVDPLSVVVRQVDSIMKQLERKYDIVVSCSDPKSSHLLAQAVLQRGVHCEKYVQFWGDPLLNDISRNFRIPRFMVKKEEEKLLNMATMVFYVSPYTLLSQKKTFEKHAEIMDCLLPAYKDVRISKPVTVVRTIGYFGDYYSNIRNIQPLYEAVKNSNYKFVIYGQSDICLESSEQISINGRISRDEIAEKEDAVDLLICLCNNSGTQIPGKLYQYAATNKPILVINDGEIDLKEQFGHYGRFMFANNNVESIKTALKTVSESDFKDLSPLYDFSVASQIEEMKRKLEVNSL